MFHEKQERVEAHIFVQFHRYCLLVTLKNYLAAHAQGLTPRAVLAKLANIQMIDVCLPTTDELLDPVASYGAGTHRAAPKVEGLAAAATTSAHSCQSQRGLPGFVANLGQTFRCPLLIAKGLVIRYAFNCENQAMVECL